MVGFHGKEGIGRHMGEECLDLMTFLYLQEHTSVFAVLMSKSRPVQMTEGPWPCLVRGKETGSLKMMRGFLPPLDTVPAACLMHARRRSEGDVPLFIWEE